MFVSVLMVRILLDECRGRGIEPAHLLSVAGLAEDGLADGGQRVPSQAFERLAQHALQATGDPALGLALGGRLPTQALQVVGYLLASAPSLRRAYADFERYAALLAESPTWAMREHEAWAQFEVSCPIAHPHTGRMANDWTLSLAYRVIRAFAPGSGDRDVTLAFAHPAPRDREPYRRVFEGAVRFGQVRNAIRFPRAWLDQPQLHGDAATCAGLRELAERMLARVKPPRRLCDQLRAMLHEERRLSRIDVPELARRLGVSQSVLRRRLAAEGVSPSQLMDEARCRVACAELVRTERSLKQLADELGYSEPSAFHRAFKRWTGKTPADYRASMT
jgi:AraC-like DNA-binding protein